MWVTSSARSHDSSQIAEEGSAAYEGMYWGVLADKRWKIRKFGRRFPASFCDVETYYRTWIAD